MPSHPKFLRKKFRLFGFLLRRVPRCGFAQFVKGLRNRKLGYTAMDLAGILPRDASVVIDVGGHRGDVTAALDFLYRPTRLITVEPNPNHTEFLRSRFSDCKNIEVVADALADREGKADFQIYGFNAASSFFQCRPGYLPEFGFDESHTSTTVTTTTLGRLLATRSISHVDLLKLDCQGAELMILKSAGDRLASIRAIYTEVWFEPIYEGAPLFGELHGFMRESGFILSGLGGFAGQGTSIQWADALYLNQRTLKP